MIFNKKKRPDDSDLEHRRLIDHIQSKVTDLDKRMVAVELELERRVEEKHEDS